MTNSDLRRNIQHLVDNVPPIGPEDLAEVSRRRRRRSVAARATVAGLSSCVALAAVGLALTGTFAGHPHTIVSVGAPVSGHQTTPAVKERAISPAAELPGANYPGCKWMTSAFVAGAPAAVRSQKSPAGFWACRSNLGPAEAALRAPSPVPVVPPNWSLSNQELYYSATGTWALEKTWSPRSGLGRITLRISNDKSAVGASVAGPLDGRLANGTKATVSTSAASSLIAWSNLGLSYAVLGSDASPANVLAAANSLP